MAKSRRNRAKGGQRSDPLVCPLQHLSAPPSECAQRKFELGMEEVLIKFAVNTGLFLAKQIKPLTDPELITIRDNRILPVLNDLKSADPKSRTAAASAVANIVQDTKCRKLLLREQIVHILLTQTLTDSSLESHAAGWSILRVVPEEEADFCVHLFRLDIIAAIAQAAMKITETLSSSTPPFVKKPKTEQDFVWNIAESLAIILSSLAEAHDEALIATSGNAYINGFLFTLLSSKATAEPVLNSVLSCMITLSEDNRVFVDNILENTQCYKALNSVKGGDGLKSVLACCVLHNVFSLMKWNDQRPGLDDASDAILVPILSNALERATLHITMANSHGAPGSTEVLRVALEALASIGTTLENSLGSPKDRVQRAPVEKFDAMDADEDGELSNHDEPEDDDADEMDEDELEADMEMVTGVDDSEALSGIDDLPTLRELIHKAIPQTLNVFHSVQGQDESGTMLRTHALSTLNNCAWTVSCIDFSEGANTAVRQAWVPVAQLIWQEAIAPILSSDTSDVEVATVVTSLAWALTRTLRGEKYLDGQEQKKFMSLYHASRSIDGNPGDSLGVRCIGVLGQLALPPAPIELNREIGVFLVTVVAGLPETPAADAVEALNQLFDIYGDENSGHDKSVFWGDNFLEHMEATVPKVRSMVKTIDKRNSTQLRTRAEEASLNLWRFIQYKNKHRP
ncbi:hypothetical protein GGR57DRAFT_496957 [Xylariaceae sp. FL1272]|nr:hypothetical protein GGR57DRAFT_496957 [Xylariaceae sp. FL1272]